MSPVFCVFTELLPLALFLAVPVAPAETRLPQGQAPLFFTITALHADSCELRQVGATKDGLTQHSTYRPEFRHLDITDAGGKKITGEEFARRVKIGTMVAVAADERQVDAAYLSVLKPDTLVLGGVIVRVEGEPAIPVRVK